MYHVRRWPEAMSWNMPNWLLGDLTEQFKRSVSKFDTDAANSCISRACTSSKPSFWLHVILTVWGAFQPCNHHLLKIVDYQNGWFWYPNVQKKLLHRTFSQDISIQSIDLDECISQSLWRPQVSRKLVSKNISIHRVFSTQSLHFHCNLFGGDLGQVKHSHMSL